MGLVNLLYIIKDKNTKTRTDLGSIEYIEYEHAYDLMQKLTKALTDIR